MPAKNGEARGGAAPQAGQPDLTGSADEAGAGSNQQWKVDWAALLTMPPQTVAEIAALLRQPIDVVEAMLRYFRSQHDYGFIKDDDAGVGESAYRFKMPDVLSHIQKWYARRQRKGLA
jgi:hypothetical protein